LAHIWLESLRNFVCDAEGMPVDDVKEPIRPPQVLVLPITARCNARCVMCGIWDRPPGAPELSLAEIETLLADPLIAGHVRKINVTGGEPSLRADVGDILAAIGKNLNAVDEVGISSNGLAGRAFRAMVAAALAAIPARVRVNFSLSLDGVGETHDAVRGVPGAFSRLTETVDWLCRETAGKANVTVSFNATLSTTNLDAAEAILDFAEKRSLGVGFTPALENDVFIASVRRGTEFSPVAHAAERLATVLDRLRERTGSETLARTARRLRGERGVPPCAARARGALVDVDGSVYPCGQSARHRFGNVREKSFSAIWASADAARARASLAAVCTSCLTNCYSDLADAATLRRPTSAAGLTGKEIDRLLADARTLGAEPEPRTWTFARVAFYGAGTNARRLLAMPAFADGPVRVVAVADDRPELHGTAIGGVPVVPLAALADLDIEAVVVTPTTGLPAMARRLAEQPDLAGLPVFGLPTGTAAPDRPTEHQGRSHRVAAAGGVSRGERQTDGRSTAAPIAEARLRIALVSKEYPPFRGGGIGTYAHHVSEALADAGHDVHVFTVAHGPADAEVTVPGVTIHRAAVPPESPAVLAGTWPETWRPLAGALGLAAAFERELLAEHARAPFDVIELPDYEAPGLLMLLRPDFEVPAVVHFHTPTALARALDGQPPQFGEDMEYLQVALADGLCAPCGAMADWVRRNARPEGPIAVIPYPFPADRFARVIAPPTGRRVLFVGRLEKRKGVDTLAAAVPRVLAQVPDATFRLIGGDTMTGPGGGSMRRHLESSLTPAVRARVEFVDALPHADLAREFAAAALCVFPSVFENYPNVCLEAMAAGRAAIVSANSGMVEMTGDAGIACPPGDPGALAERIVALLDDPDRAARLGVRAFARVREVADPRVVADRRAAFYRETIARPRRSLAEKLAGAPPGILARALPILTGLAVADLRRAAAAGDSRAPGVDRLVRVLERGRARGWSRVVLYGGGAHTRRLLADDEEIRATGVAVVAIADASPDLRGNTVAGVPVIAPDAVVALRPDAVVVSSDAHEREIVRQATPIAAAGIPVETLYGG
jgi:glycosyltransferase involved in cell wall biosynthesis/MoaA/NifB/PqqE/SkfB family radical SAM enzyme